MHCLWALYPPGIPRLYRVQVLGAFDVLQKVVVVEEDKVEPRTSMSAEGKFDAINRWTGADFANSCSTANARINEYKGW